MATINFNNIVFRVKDEIKSAIKGEIFRPTEYDNYYISNFGRVVSTNKSYYGIVILKSHIACGYERVGIISKGKKYLPFVHRLVATAFIPNPNNYRVVNHKDENKLNNNVDNLEWYTDEYNKTYSSGQIIEQIDINSREVINTFNSIRIASRTLNIDFSAIRKCCINYDNYHKGLAKNLHYYKGSYWRYKK